MVLRQKNGGCYMTYQKAMQILDKVREGVHYPAWVINKALELTGDIDGHGTL